MKVIELKLTKQGLKMSSSISEIHVVREGKILALELDSQNREFIDSSYTYDHTLQQTDLDVINKIYIMDDKENLLLLRQKKDHESGHKYKII